MKMTATAALIILFCSAATSQITLTSADAQSILAPGKSWRNLSASSVNISMNVGAPSSTAQSWQVPVIAYTDTFRLDNMLPSATPYTSQYTRATHARRVIVSSGDMTHTSYSYYRITNDSLFSLGFATRTQGPGIDTTIFDTHVTLDELLPIQFGKTFTRRDSIPIAAGAYIVQRTVSTCDAFDSLVTPAGTFQTLRTKEVSISDTYFAGQLFSKDSSITLNWFTKEGYWCNVEPKDRQQSSGSLIIDYVSYLIPAGPTRVTEPSSRLPADLTLRQNYPNPFNPSTTIEYTLPKSDFASLSVLNELGQEVASLVHGSQNAGNHRITFDASGLPSGVYFYRLTTSSQVRVGRMTLLK